MKRRAAPLYYGDGKGKSTAAFGQAVRAWGGGWRVLFVQFLKDARARSGEVAAAAALGPRFRLLRAELPAPVLADPGPEGRRAAARGLRRTAGARPRRGARAGATTCVVLDEALVACHLRLLPAADVRRAVRPAGARGVRLVILTGRWAPRGAAARGGPGDRADEGPAPVRPRRQGRSMASITEARR